jgi:hypothetical protein
MNLIELLFRIAPDGGSGSTELIIGVLILIALLIASRGRRPFADLTKS